MSTSIVQTAAAASGSVEGNASLSGNTNNTGATGSALCTVGGTVGATPTDDRTDAVDAAAADLNMIWLECTIPAGYSWESGDWTIPIQIISGDMDAQLDEIHIIEVNADYSDVVVLASSTGIARTINTAQVESFTVNQATSVPGANGDHVIIIMAFDETAGHAAANITWSPTQTITAPGTVVDVADAPGRQWFSPAAGGQVDAVASGTRDYFIPALGVMFTEDHAEAAASAVGRPPLSRLPRQAPFRSSLY